MNPKAFISYSWGSPAHQQWVLDLATQLRENGVDVTIDKWDLKEGHDAIAFMEKMVTDKEIQKVVVVLDRKYAEKSDKREGGVGTESQIISPEIYAKTDQNKFVGVISELNADGKPFLPTFYKSRIYIDLSSSDTYAQNFDQLLRWIFDKPAFPKPTLGKPPEFLNETVVLIPTRSRANRAVDLFKTGSVGAVGALDDYLSILAESFEQLRIERTSDKNFDDLLVESIGAFLPYRDEFIQVMSTVARFSAADESIRLVRKFFEQLIPYMSRPANVNQYYREDFDNFKFLIHELFLYVIAILIKHDRFDAVADLLQAGFFAGNSPDYTTNPMQPFTIFRNHLQSLKSRNERLKLSRMSLHADLLRERAETSGVLWRDLMQADFVMFMRDSLAAWDEERRPGWYPETLIFYEEFGGSFEVFARAESKAYFNKMKGMIGVSTKDKLMQILPHFGVPDSVLYIPRWDWYSVSIEQAVNIEKLASKS